MATNPAAGNASETGFEEQLLIAAMFACVRDLCEIGLKRIK